MDIGSLFWIFLILISFQPLIRQKLIETARFNLIARIEKKRKSRVILIVHRQETMSFMGFPIMRFLNMDDSEEVLRALHMTDSKTPVDIVLHTPGGLVLAAVQIARAIQMRKAPVRVIVPHMAMSGGTLIALAADEIIMSPHAVLGPVDPQLGQLPAASILKAVQTKKPADIDDTTLIQADMAKKAIQQLETFVHELLKEKMPAKQAQKTAKLLTQGTWTHDYGITSEEAKKFGLPVNTEIPNEFLELMSLYPQPMKKMPTVEYLPNQKST
ncbi:MAG: hypothetical protein D6767_02025 [Candidatus Hydrogenedentota bacterium]|nr:MAG: hypothetical protein D6767_02025 [Candidatus Hydrogenedentota bacterium]